MNRLRVITLIMYVLLIFFVSSRPNLRPPGPDFEFKDKVAHLCEYMVLGGLLFTGIGWTVTRSKMGTFLFLFAVGVSVAALDELLQSYIPGRSMDPYDWLADAVGCAVGVGVGLLVGSWRRNRRGQALSDGEKGVA
jgi:VanZ family protein